MSAFVCPHCGETTEIFRAGGGPARGGKAWRSPPGRDPDRPPHPGRRRPGQPDRRAGPRFDPRAGVHERGAGPPGSARGALLAGPAHGGPPRPRPVDPRPADVASAPALGGGLRLPSRLGRDRARVGQRDVPATRVRKPAGRGFLGVERAGKFFDICARRLARDGRPNVRLVRADAFDLLAVGFPPQGSRRSTPTSPTRGPRSGTRSGGCSRPPCSTSPRGAVALGGVLSFATDVDPLFPVGDGGAR